MQQSKSTDWRENIRVLIDKPENDAWFPGPNQDIREFENSMARVIITGGGVLSVSEKKWWPILAAAGVLGLRYIAQEDDRVQKKSNPTTNANVDVNTAPTINMDLDEERTYAKEINPQYQQTKSSVHPQFPVLYHELARQIQDTQPTQKQVHYNSFGLAAARGELKGMGSFFNEGQDTYDPPLRPRMIDREQASIFMQNPDQTIHNPPERQY